MPLRLPPWNPPYRDGESLPQTFNAPPTLRLNIEASDQWFAEAGDSAVRAAEAIIQEHEARIQQIVQAHRGYFGLSSGGGFQRKHATLPGLELMHDVNVGLETLHFTVRPENAILGTEAAAILAEHQLQQPCLLVFYGGNKLAAYSMAELPELKLLYQVVLKKSSWGAKPLLTSQFKFARGLTSTVMSPLVVKAGVVTAHRDHYFTTCAPVGALHRFRQSRTRAEIVPLQNGDEASLYTPHDILSKHRSPSSGGVSGAEPICITSDGTYYYPWEVDSPVVVVSGFNATQYPIPDTVTDAMQRSFDDAGDETMIQAGAWVGTVQHGVGDLQVDVSTVAATFDSGTGSAVGAVSYKVPVPIYRANGKIDKVGEGAETVDIAVDIVWRVWDTGSSQDGSYVLGRIFGLDATYSWHATAPHAGGDTLAYSGDRLTVGVYPFPPWLSADGIYAFVLRYSADDSGTKENYVVTPYKRFENVTFEPWLHVSNGKHFIQGFITDGTSHLYCDKVDISGRLPTDVKNVQTVLMDVPLSRIQQLV